MTIKRYVYDHGFTFAEELGKNLNHQLNKRIGRHKPSLIIIDGAQGEGKTTLLVQIIDAVNKLKGLPPCSLEIENHPQIALGGEEFTKLFTECKRQGLPIIGYDEAGDFSKRGAISGFNARLIRRFETFRSSNIMVVLCLPNLGILDQHLFDLQIVRGLLHLKDRGLNQGNFYAYSGFEVGWIRYYMAKLPKPLKYQSYNKCGWSFRGHFLNLEPERQKALAKLSDYGKETEDVKAEVKYLGLLTYVDMSRRLNRSVVWVRKVVTDLKIREDRIIKKVKYFKKEVFEILLEHKDSTGVR